MLELKDIFTKENANEAIKYIILPKEDAVSIYRMESYKESIGREINTGNIL